MTPALLVDLQPPRRRRQGRHRRFHRGQRHAPLQRRRDAAQNVRQVPAPQQLGVEHLRIPCRGDNTQTTAARADRDVRPPHGEIADGVVHAVEHDALPLAPGAGRQREAHRIVGVDHGRRARRQGGEQFVLRLGDALRGAEPLQVLHPHRRQNAQRRVDDVADVADLARPVGGHLHHEDLVIVLQVFADDAGDPHRGVDAGGRLQHAVPRRQEVRHDVLRAGLPVAPRDPQHSAREPAHAPVRLAQERLRNGVLPGEHGVRREQDDAGSRDPDHGQRRDPSDDQRGRRRDEYQPGRQQDRGGDGDGDPERHRAHPDRAGRPLQPLAHLDRPVAATNEMARQDPDGDRHSPMESDQRRGGDGGQDLQGDLAPGNQDAPMARQPTLVSVRLVPFQLEDVETVQAARDRPRPRRGSAIRPPCRAMSSADPARRVHA